MDLAIKDVRRHAGKFVTTIAGVALLLAVVLTMNGIYRGSIADGMWLIDTSRVDLWVVERYRGGPFNEASRVDPTLYRSVGAIPGVVAASPFILYPVQRDIAGRSRQLSIVGYDVFGGLGGPPVIVEGRPVQAAHYEIVADLKLGLRVGDHQWLALHDYRVVGVTRGAVDSGGNPLLYMSLLDAQEVLYQRDNEAVRSERVAVQRSAESAGFHGVDADRVVDVTSGNDTQAISAVLVRLAPGADSFAVRKGIEQRLYLSVYTPNEERELMLQGRLRQITLTLGIFRTLLVIVSVVIMSLIVYVLTMEKVKALATLKLIGAPTSVIVRLILEQSLVLAFGGFVGAYTLVTLLHGYFPRTLVFAPTDTWITFGIVIGGGILASVFGIWRAMKTPPSLALAG